jgi:hypothetical protein
MAAVLLAPDVLVVQRRRRAHQRSHGARLHVRVDRQQRRREIRHLHLRREEERQLAPGHLCHLGHQPHVQIALARLPVAGYVAWTHLKRFVKKGEHGIPILAPCIYEDKDNPDDDSKTRRFFKVVYVFDVSQTDGEPLPDAETTIRGEDDRSLIPLAVKVLSAAGVTVDFADLGSSDGNAAPGRITINSTATPLSQLQTLCHEWAHQILHVRQAYRPDKQTRELQAEAAAYVAMRAFGYDLPQPANYIAIWHGDAKTIIANTHAIKQAAAEIIAALQPHRALDI